MNKSTNQKPKTDSQIDLQLTAYLDGELGDTERAAVEKRLSDDVYYTKRMQQLQKTWDLLDLVPRPEPTASFTQSTLELVINGAARDEKKKRDNRLAWIFRAAVLVGLPLIVLLASYQYSQSVYKQPVDQLLEDLPVIENVDVYQKADSIEFLTLLEESGLFDENKEFLFDDEFEE